MPSQLLDWLLEPNNPSVRYYTLRYLLDRSPDETDVVAAQQAIMTEGPVPQILALQNPGGWWGEPEDRLGPMYRSPLWQLMFLADLHADPTHPQIKLGREHVFAMQNPGGDFYSEPQYRKQLPSDACCFEGQITWAMLCLTPDGDSAWNRQCVTSRSRLSNQDLSAATMTLAPVPGSFEDAARVGCDPSPSPHPGNPDGAASRR